jgi:tetratricopeptide (TPR) repeat protein
MSLRSIDLLSAINEIKSAYEEGSPQRSPFFFVVGAGISYPSIPLATEITVHCQQKAEPRVLKREKSSTESTPLGEYSYWFDKAYPQPINRQRYLRELIEKKPITDANLRLAHILLSRRITNLVITPNFDDLLSRSLNIFGEPHIVSDHPRTVDRIDLDGNDIQIVHVHGSYRFYDCRNLREELESRARPSLTTTNTIAAFLDRALSFRSPIVVGYSGWESDVIMAALRRRLEGNTLPYRVYWCCFQEESVQELPVWLREHEDVRIVTASRAAPSGETDKVPAKGEMTEVEEAERPKLPARTVFEAFSRAFELDQPELTKDPLAFFARQLRHSTSSEVGNKDGVYFFGDIVTRVERAAQLLREEDKSIKSKKGGSEAEIRQRTSALLQAKDAVRRSRYSEALDLAITQKATKLNKDELLEWFEILSNSLKRTPGDHKKQLTGVTLLIGIGKRLAVPDDPASYKRYIFVPLSEKAEILRRANRWDDAIEIHNQIISELSGTKEPELKRGLLYAQTRKALTLNSMKRADESIVIYESILPELEASHGTRGRWLLVQTLYNRSVYLSNLGRNDEATTALDEFVRRFDSAKDPWTQVLVAGALLRKARLERVSGHIDEAIASCKRVLELYADSESPQVKHQFELAGQLKVGYEELAERLKKNETEQPPNDES